MSAKDSGQQTCVHRLVGCNKHITLGDAGNWLWESLCMGESMGVRETSHFVPYLLNLL